jgi:Protein of unknown function (DUF2384)
MESASRRSTARVSSDVVPPAVRESSAVRRRLSAPALRTFFNITRAWQLSASEERALLGWPPSSTFHKYKSGAPGTLSVDTLTRLSLVLGIYKSLHVLYPEPELADTWVKLPNTNPLFDGRPALKLMTDGGVDGLYRVRRLLDARRGS